MASQDGKRFETSRIKRGFPIQESHVAYQGDDMGIMQDVANNAGKGLYFFI